MKGFLTALQFLTIIRLWDDPDPTEDRFGVSMAFFPLVGLVIGLILVAVRFAASLIFPPAIADVFVIIALVVVTGGLHLDGFADTVDGLAGGKDRERVLAIMKDSRIGSFAVIGLILILLVKVVALTEVNLLVKTKALLIVPVLGRWATVQLAALFPYARAGGGTARVFVAFTGKLEYAVAFLITALIVVGLFSLKGAAILAIAAAVAFGIGIFFNRRIGGVTGDVMGATCELVEAVTLLLVCSFFL
ncbi:MAG: adenosylcobinamide-GDP ribazoletransferase [Deltaproteobacteria bacterium]|nr:adenosylcobinamide-GDP ribazoletransferase [Deltaproteobacteria bacterium]